MAGERSTSSPGWLRAVAALAAALAATLGVAACGGDGDNAEEPREAAAPSAETPTGTTSEPPPETAPEGSGEASATTTGEGSESTLADDAATGPQSCPDVVITPNSGDGLFDVEAEGITCEDATAALEAWGTSGYPGESPPGFSCEEVATNANGSVRLRCEQEASGAVVEFETGG